MNQFSKIQHLLLVLDLILIYASESHDIMLTPIDQCPEGGSCVTLSMLAANTSNYIDSSTAMIFLAENHTLSSELSVSNIDKFLRLSTNGSITVSITCSGNASLNFINITQLQISGLEFISCSSRVELVDHFTLEDSSFHSRNSDGSALELTQTNTNIVRSSFTFNTVGTYQNHLTFLRFSNLDRHLNMSYVYGARVGGALVVTNSNLDISSSLFDSNTAELGGAIFSEFYSNVTIRDCTFVNNSAADCSDDRCSGGALFVDSDCTIMAHNSTFINSTSKFSGGAIALFKGTYIGTQNVFSNNEASRQGGVVYAFSNSIITVDNSSFSNNKAGYGGGVMYANYNSSITVDNSDFHNNEASHTGGAVSAFSSSSIIVNSSAFSNNGASIGGAMYALSSSSITIDSSSFNNNEADISGGVM